MKKSWLDMMILHVKCLTDLVKGMVVLGALAGAATVANPVFAEENGVNSTLESEISPSTGIVDQDSFVFGYDVCCGFCLSESVY